jgi:hypothetical protein
LNEGGHLPQLTITLNNHFMRPSHSPTNYVIVSAYGGYESDPATFAIITLSPSWIEALRERLAKVSSWKDDISLIHLTFDDENVAFFIDQFLSGRRTGARYMKSGIRGWGFVSLDTWEMKDWLHADSAGYSDLLFRLNGKGQGQFIGRGIYYEHPFSTDWFSIADLLNHFPIKEIGFDTK